MSSFDTNASPRSVPLTRCVSLFSFMRGRQQLSCLVLRPPSGPNARPQDNIPLHKGNNENSLELNTKILTYFKTPFFKYFMKLLIFNIKWLETFKNMIKVYQVSRRYIMLFMHNNKHLPLTGFLTLLQWTIHNTACLVLHPAKYFDIYGVKWLKQANQASRPADRLRESSMHKWMKGNVWRIKNVKRVSVSRKYIVIF